MGITAVGKVTSITGEAYTESDNGLVQLHEGSLIYQNTITVTENSSHIEIVFNDNTVLSQGENSRLTIDDYVFDSGNSANSSLLFELGQGTFRVITGEIAKQNPEQFNVKSPLASIGIRGTDFSVQTGDDQDLVMLNQIDENHVMVIKDQFGTIRFMNEAGTLVVLRVGEPMGDTIFASQELIDTILNLTPITFHIEDSGTGEGGAGIHGADALQHGFLDNDYLYNDHNSSDQFWYTRDFYGSAQQDDSNSLFLTGHTQDLHVAENGAFIPGISNPALFTYYHVAIFNGGDLFRGSDSFYRAGTPQDAGNNHSPVVSVENQIFSSEQSSNFFNLELGGLASQRSQYDVYFTISTLELFALNGANSSVNSSPATITRLVGDSTNNVLTGLDGNDMLSGLTGADSLNGGAGNDTLKGGTGVDTLIGAANNDTFVVWGTFANGTYSGVDPSQDNLAVSSPVSHVINGGIIDGGSGSDTLVTYGTTSFSSVTIAGIETVLMHSDVTFSAGQLDGSGVSTLHGDGAGILRFVDNGTTNLSVIDLGGVSTLDIGHDVILIMSQANLAGITSIIGSGHIQAAQGETLDFTGISVSDFIDQPGNDEPVFLSSSVSNIEENGSAVLTATTVDPDDEIPTYSITGGVDAALFSIDNTTGQLSFNTAPDFEAPGDVGADNIYNVDITADDGVGGTRVQSLVVNVTDINESPVFDSSANASIDENQTDVLIVSASDPENDTLTYTVSGGVDAALFSIDNTTGQLSFITAPDFEAPRDAGADNIYNVDITASDDGGGTTDQAVSVIVNDVYEYIGPVNHNPTSISLSNSFVTEEFAGMNVGFLSAVDPDQGDILTFSINDTNSPFEIGTEGSSGIMAQRYDVSGNKVGTEFHVNSSLEGTQWHVSTAGLNDGGFVITWESLWQDGDDGGVYGQRYDAAGDTVGIEFQINSYTVLDQDHGRVVGLDDGGFVTVWESYGQDGSRDGVYGQRYDSSGNSVNGEFHVSTYTIHDQENPSVASLGASGFIVTWESYNQDSGVNDEGVYSQRYDLSGSRIGIESLVNIVTTGNQDNPSVAGLYNAQGNLSGGYVITWDSSDTSDDGVWARAFDNAGNALSAEVLINTQINLDQHFSEVTGLINGNFVVTWESLNQDGSSEGTYGQIMEVAGGTLNQVGSEFLVNTYTTNNQDNAKITSLPDGGFIVTWESGYLQDGSYDGIYGQRYDASGNTVGSEFQINTFTDMCQDMPDVTSLADGGFLVTWESEVQDGNGFTLKLKDTQALDYETQQVINVTVTVTDQAGGSLDVVMPITITDVPDKIGSEIHLSTTTTNDQQDVSVTGLSGGGFVAVWESYNQESGSGASGDGIYGRLFDDNGNPLSNEFQINTYEINAQHNAIVTSLEDGGFVVAWASYGQDGYNEGIYGQRYDVGGSTVGSEFKVNTTILGYQEDLHLTGLKDGGFVVTWESPDIFVDGIFGQRYDSAGNVSGSEFAINTTTSSDEEDPAIASLSNGGFVVVWESDNPGVDGTIDNVHGRIFASDGTSSGSDLVINSTITGDQDMPNIAGLVGGGFVVAWTQAYGVGSSDNWGVFAKIFDNSGTVVLNEFQVNSKTFNIQDSPSITALDDGGFVIVWESMAQTGDDSLDVFGQRYNATGQTIGGEFLINSYTVGEQNDAYVGALANGDFVTVWESMGQDGSLDGVYGQVFHGVNSNPVATDDFAANKAIQQSVLVIDSAELLANDTDPNTSNILSVISVTNPNNCTVILVGSEINFQANSGFIGNATFDYTVSDGHGGSDIATVTVAVDNKVELSNVAGAGNNSGFVINGIAANDNSGVSVSSAGDVNGDGFADLIIGADGANSSAGESYVVFGKSGGAPVDLSSLQSNSSGFQINGIDANDSSGISVSSAGDVNGDGYADLIIGAEGANSSAGESYVVFGSANPAPVNLSSIVLDSNTGGFVINGIDASDNSGISVSSAGDINGDGLADLLIGASSAGPNTTADYTGESYVVFGKSDGIGVNLSDISLGTDTGGFVINGIAAGDYSGRSVSSAGDVNGDGLDDMLIGAPFRGPGTTSNQSGESYVVFGKSDGGVVNLSTIAAGTGGFVVNGDNPNDHSGMSVSSAGDVNGDGLADLIIGAPDAYVGSVVDAGMSYVVFGKDTDTNAVNLSDIASGTGGFVINGIAASDHSGYSVSSAGDVNGDGLADLIIGAYNADSNGNSSSGESYVVFGKLDTTSVNLSDVSNGTGGFVINGIAVADNSGFSVSSAGDVNGDGFADLMVGAYHADANGSSSGESYVIFGGDFTGDVTQMGTTADDTLFGTNVDDILIGHLGADNLSGAIGNDVLYGGAGDDTISGGPGNDTIDGGSGVDFLYSAGMGHNLINGGDGNDWIYYSGEHSAVTVNLASRTAYSESGLNDTLTSIENVKGSIYNDHITGGGGPNILMGGSGDDTFTYNTGDVVNGESVYGEQGADTIFVKTTTSFFDMGTVNGIGQLRIAAGQTGIFDPGMDGFLSGLTDVYGYSGTGSQETIEFRGHVSVDNTMDLSGMNPTFTYWDSSDRILITGQDGADTITGSQGDDIINAGAGNDTIVGGGGSDTITGGGGNDIFSYAHDAELGDTITDFNADGSGDKIYLNVSSNMGLFTGAKSGSAINVVTNTPSWTPASLSEAFSRADSPQATVPHTISPGLFSFTNLNLFTAAAKNSSLASGHMAFGLVGNKLYGLMGGVSTYTTITYMYGTTTYTLSTATIATTYTIATLSNVIGVGTGANQISGADIIIF